MLPPHVLRRVAPLAIALLLVEAVLYVGVDRSATLHDLYATPAYLVAAFGLVAVVMRLRSRRVGERRRGDRRDTARGASDAASSTFVAPSGVMPPASPTASSTPPRGATDSVGKANE